ncbi:hypothetical protein [Sorangium sp. So ce388]|uniref:hypothetical protein n=1 Tax=Sorangium sp. So ce388 TaxID=3133309 RepID=UPI003F5C5BFB
MRPRVLAAVLLLAGCAPDPAVYDLFYYGPLEPVAVADGGGGQGGSGTAGEGGAGGDAGAGGSGGDGGYGGGPPTATSSTTSSSTGEVEPQCRTPDDCVLVPSACRWPTCVDGRCGVETPEPGTPAPDDVEGDCSKNVCDGSGVASVYDPTDIPLTPNSCMRVECTHDGPAWTTGPAGIPCEEPGKFCDGRGNCVAVIQGRKPME